MGWLALVDIDAALKRWPDSLSGDAYVSQARRNEIKRLGDHVAQIHRALASVGATPEQLALLGSDAIDDHLQLEMSLLAREAAWQLRTHGQPHPPRAITPNQKNVACRRIEAWYAKHGDLDAGAVAGG